MEKIVWGLKNSTTNFLLSLGPLSSKSVFFWTGVWRIYSAQKRDQILIRFGMRAYFDRISKLFFW